MFILDVCFCVYICYRFKHKKFFSNLLVLHDEVDDVLERFGEILQELLVVVALDYDVTEPVPQLAEVVACLNFNILHCASFKRLSN